MRWISDYHLDWQLDWRGPSEDTSLVPGFGPGGVATFALDLQHGYTVTCQWPTDIIPSASGKEQRISQNDRAKESYSGAALLLGDATLDVRAALAKYAALGSQFLLGLPHEALTIRADSAGTVVPVHSTALCDWAKEGQRVIVSRNRAHVEAVIQSATANAITLNVAPGSVGKRGGFIMPARPIILEPQQEFARYRTKAELWKIQARAATFDFAMTLATLALGPLTASAGLEDATLTARHAGSSPTFAMLPDGIGAATMDETASGVTIHYEPVGGFAPSTIEQVFALLEASTLLNPTGTWGSGSLQAADEVPETPLAGGDTQSAVGTGAAIAMYAGRPVWDERLVNAGTNSDVIHAMTEIVDYGGVPYAVGRREQPDWGRAVPFRARSNEQWQWLKLFLATVKGPQKSFWLSTWRPDLGYVSHAGTQLTVRGDVAAWYPKQRQHLAIPFDDSSLAYRKIASAANNGDGTWTLTLDAALGAGTVTMVSWLELARFNSSTFTITFDAKGFSV